MLLSIFRQQVKPSDRNHLPNHTLISLISDQAAVIPLEAFCSSQTALPQRHFADWHLALYLLLEA